MIVYSMVTNTICDQECEVTSVDSQYAAITVIRLLDLKRTKPDVFARLMRLEDHNQMRREEEEDLWDYHQTHIVEFLKQVRLPLKYTDDL